MVLFNVSDITIQHSIIMSFFQLTDVTVQHWPSCDIPTVTHFCRRQYWHRFRLIRMIRQPLGLSHGLYVIFCRIVRRKKPCCITHKHAPAVKHCKAGSDATFKHELRYWLRISASFKCELRSWLLISATLNTYLDLDCLSPPLLNMILDLDY